MPLTGVCIAGEERVGSGSGNDRILFTERKRGRGVDELNEPQILLEELVESEQLSFAVLQDAKAEDDGGIEG